MKKQSKRVLIFLSHWALPFGLGMLVCLLALVWRLGGFSILSSTMKYAAVLRIVQTQYIGEADPAELTDAALDAALDTLDRWSYYMTEQEYDDYLNFSNNRYQGIGVTVSKDEETGGFRIQSLTADGPAALAGVQIGEIILACDGTDVTGGTSDELKALIQAAYGESITLTLQTTDGGQRSVSVSCENIAVDPVSWQLMDDGYGYIRLKNFEAGMADSAIAAVDELVALGAKGIVFDVRSNPGGRVTELCELLDYLLPEGDLFIRVDNDGNEKIERSDSEWVDIPLAVIVNASSYSAAEFFAAALQEYDRAAVTGEATTGKGRSQLTYALSDGSAVHLSCYKYLTPNRVDLSETGGIVPDEEITLSDDEQSLFSAGALDPEEDPQVRAAVQMMAQ